MPVGRDDEQRCATSSAVRKALVVYEIMYDTSDSRKQGTVHQMGL